jgi:RNA 3'-terminal phosphate cyclase
VLLDDLTLTFSFGLDLERRGYFPLGGGEATLKVQPVTQLKPIDLTDPGRVVSVHCRTFISSSIPLEKGQRVASAADKMLKKWFESQGLTKEQEQEKEKEKEEQGSGSRKKGERKTKSGKEGRGGEAEVGEVQFEMDFVKEDKAYGEGIGIS